MICPIAIPEAMFCVVISHCEVADVPSGSSLNLVVISFHILQLVIYQNIHAESALIVKKFMEIYI